MKWNKFLFGGFVALLSLQAFARPLITELSVGENQEATIGFEINPLYLYQVHSSTNLIDWVEETDFKSYGEWATAFWSAEQSGGRRFFKLMEKTPSGEMETLYAPGTNTHKTLISSEISTVPVGYSVPAQSDGLMFASSELVPMAEGDDGSSVEIKSTFGISDLDNDLSYDTLFRDDVCELPGGNHIRLYSIAEKAATNTTVSVSFSSSKNGITKQASYVSLYTNQWISSSTELSQPELRGFAQSCLPSLIGVDSNSVAIDFPKIAVTHVDYIGFEGDFEVLNPDPQIAWHFEQLVADMFSYVPSILSVRVTHYGGDKEDPVFVRISLVKNHWFDWIVESAQKSRFWYETPVESFAVEPGATYRLGITLEGSSPNGEVIARIEREVEVPEYGTIHSEEASVSRVVQEGDGVVIAEFYVSYSGDFDVPLNFSCPGDWHFFDAHAASSSPKQYYVMIPFRQDLEPGTYETTLSISSTHCDNSPFEIPISVIIQSPAPQGMVQIPAGTNAGTDPDFGAYSLTIEQPFYMDATEVTKAQWDTVYNWAVANGYSFDNAGLGKASTHPVHTVNWYDCVKWCNARSEKEGKTPCYNLSDWGCDFSANGYRLPTSDEWEYAARGGLSGKRFPWGDTITHSQATYNSSSAYSYDVSSTRNNHPLYEETSPAGSFSPNDYGLYDVSGNVWEWCWDASFRGGSWFDDAYNERCGDPGWIYRSSYRTGGFRPVCR